MPEDAATATQEPVSAPVAPEASTPTPEPPVAAETPAADSVEALPEWAQKELRKARDEAAGYRTKNKDLTAAQQAKFDAIAKAMGLSGDDDPVKAAQTAAEQREAAQVVARNLRAENAVLRSAGKHGADPEALTDSRSFMRALEGLDTEADDFASQVDAAIVTALEANPTLKKNGSAPPARSGGPVGGGAAVPGQLSEDDLKGMTPAQIVKAQEDGLLKEVLSKRVEDQ